MMRPVVRCVVWVIVLSAFACASTSQGPQESRTGRQIRDRAKKDEALARPIPEDKAVFEPIVDESGARGVRVSLHHTSHDLHWDAQSSTLQGDTSQLDPRTQAQIARLASTLSDKGPPKELAMRARCSFAMWSAWFRCCINPGRCLVANACEIEDAIWNACAGYFNED